MSTPSPATRRHASTPRLLRASQAVLIAGAILCAAAAFGPLWVIRAGIALAMVAGIVAVVLAFRHIRATRREHAARILQMTKDQGALLTSERRRNADVIDVLTERATTATKRAEQHRIKINEVNASAAQLRAENSTLRSVVTARDLTIKQVRETLRTRDTEISLLRDDLARAAVIEDGQDDVQDLRQAG